MIENISPNFQFLILVFILSIQRKLLLRNNETWPEKICIASLQKELVRKFLGNIVMSLSQEIFIQGLILQLIPFLIF